MKGWFRDSYRHSLAARGYAFKIRSISPIYHLKGKDLTPVGPNNLPLQDLLENFSFDDEVQPKKPMIGGSKEFEQLKDVEKKDIMRLVRINKKIDKRREVMADIIREDTLKNQLKSYEEMLKSDSLEIPDQNIKDIKEEFETYPSTLKSIKRMGINQIKDELSNRTTRRDRKQLLKDELERRGLLSVYEGEVALEKEKRLESQKFKKDKVLSSSDVYDIESEDIEDSEDVSDEDFGDIS
jgi:hypothetical protein